MQLPVPLKQVIKFFLFPVYSLFSRRFGFTIFYPSARGWRAYTRGKTFAVQQPSLWTLEYFRRFVPVRGGIVFDVGGEKGFETQQFSDLVGPCGRVYVFECFPIHIAKLREIAIQHANVTVVERACWSHKTTLTFFTGHTAGSNTAVPDATGQQGQPLANPAKEKLEVNADCLDSLWERLCPGQEIDFLKMDIEGAEYEALAGAKQILAHTKRAVIAAYHIREGERTASRVAAVLRDAGFDVEIGDNFHVYAQRP